jgi:hypothetical protein
MSLCVQYSVNLEVEPSLTRNMLTYEDEWLGSQQEKCIARHDRQGISSRFLQSVPPTISVVKTQYGAPLPLTM